jgi:hypothetical protein
MLIILSRSGRLTLAQQFNFRRRKRGIIRSPPQRLPIQCLCGNMQFSIFARCASKHMTKIKQPLRDKDAAVALPSYRYQKILQSSLLIAIRGFLPCTHQASSAVFPRLSAADAWKKFENRAARHLANRWRRAPESPVSRRLPNGVGHQ